MNASPSAFRTASRVLRSPFLLLAAALIAVMFDVFFLGRTVLPLQLPGVTPTGPHGYAGVRIDFPWSTSIDPAGAYDAEFPWAAYFVNSVRSGSVPLWNPYQGLGQPHLANYVSAVMAPVNWLNLVLPSTWWDLVFLTDWLLSAYFVYLVAQVLGLRRDASIVGGLAVLAAGFFPGYLAVRSIIGSVVYLPLLVFGVERTFQDPQWKWRHAVLAAGTYGLATGGHPAPALIGVVLVTLFAAGRMAFEPAHWRTFAVRIVPPMLFGGLLAAPLWLLFGDYVLREAIAVRGTDNGVFAFPWRGLPLTVFPFLYGPLSIDLWSAVYSGMAWCPAGLSFLAVVGLASPRARRPGPLPLVAVIGLAAAKIYGVPIINDIGRLPLLNQLSFGYASGFVAVGICVFAALGFAHLQDEPPGRWKSGMWIWLAYVVAMIVIGLSTVRSESAFYARDAWRTKYLYVAAGSGLFWATAFPVALLLVKRRGADSGGALTFVAAAGLLFQAVAYFPSGSPRGFALVTSASALAFVAVGAAAAGLARRFRHVPPFAVAVGLAAVVVAICGLARPRLPDRYDVFTPPPFVEALRTRPNAPRIYPLDGILFPEFAAPFGLSGITNLDNLVTVRGGSFFNRFMDPGAPPARFYGVDAARHPGARPPMVEFWERKRYWDLAAVRYVLTRGQDLNVQVVSQTPTIVRPVPVALGSGLVTNIPCSAGAFDSVGALLATYARTNRGRVELAVTGPDGTAAATATVDASTLQDNAERGFKLSSPVCAHGERDVTAKLSFRADEPGAMVAVYQDAAVGAGFIYRATAARPGDELTLIAHDDSTGVDTWENPGAFDRAFLATRIEQVADRDAAYARLAAIPDLRRTALVESPFVCQGSDGEAGSDPGRVQEIRVTPNQVTVRYDARATGVLTLSDAHAEGWRATVNGQSTPVLRVDGAFRGVCIDRPGTQEVVFTYRPPRWTLALSLASTGGLGVLGLFVFDRRRSAGAGLRAPRP